MPILQSPPCDLGQFPYRKYFPQYAIHLNSTTVSTSILTMVTVGDLQAYPCACSLNIHVHAAICHSGSPPSWLTSFGCLPKSNGQLLCPSFQPQCRLNRWIAHYVVKVSEKNLQLMFTGFENLAIHLHRWLSRTAIYPMLSRWSEPASWSGCGSVHPAACAPLPPSGCTLPAGPSHHPWHGFCLSDHRQPLAKKNRTKWIALKSKIRQWLMTHEKMLCGNWTERVLPWRELHKCAMAKLSQC